MKEIELSYWKDFDSNQPYKPTLSPANQQGVNCRTIPFIVLFSTSPRLLWTTKRENGKRAIKPSSLRLLLLMI